MTWLSAPSGVGRRKHGKPQLRIDESRKWLAVAAGDDGAVAAMMTLLLGVRASEVVSRVVRDVDDGGRLLWIPDSKTEVRPSRAPGRRQVIAAWENDGKQNAPIVFPAENEKPESAWIPASFRGAVGDRTPDL